MTTTRRFVGDDLFRFSTTNMDPLTETYSTSFYLSYLTRWPGMNQCQEGVSGRISSYMIGKAEGRGKDWHGHVSALTVAPEFRRLGLGKTLMAELERVSDKECVSSIILNPPRAPTFDYFFSIYFTPTSPPSVIMAILLIFLFEGVTQLRSECIRH